MLAALEHARETIGNLSHRHKTCARTLPLSNLLSFGRLQKPGKYENNRSIVNATTVIIILFSPAAVVLT